MQTRHLAIAVLTAAFAFGTLSASAVAQSREAPSGVSAKRHAKKPAVRAARTGMKIACPKGGCRLVPASCKVTMEETWEGPTGYELIDCP